MSATALKNTSSEKLNNMRNVTASASMDGHSPFFRSLNSPNASGPGFVSLVEGFTTPCNDMQKGLTHHLVLSKTCDHSGQRFLVLGRQLVGIYPL